MQRSFPSPLKDAPLPQAAPPRLETEDPIPEALYDVLQSPSLFGRILLIAAVRNAATDQYDSGEAACFHTPMVDLALRRLHSEIFTTWLSLPLQRQKADVSVYVNLTPAPERTAKIKNLLNLAERSIPAGAKPPERRLFVQDLKIVQSLFTYDY
jgi:hypothetical protein